MLFALSLSHHFFGGLNQACPCYLSIVVSWRALSECTHVLRRQQRAKCPGDSLMALSVARVVGKDDDDV